MRAKLPKGKGIWPAIWMLGADIDQDSWPSAAKSTSWSCAAASPTSSDHHALRRQRRRHRQKGSTDKVLPSGNFSDAFHLFSVVRSKDQMRFYLDGHLYYTFTAGDVGAVPLQQPVLYDSERGRGGRFHGNPDATTVFPQQMQVDYVRYYQYK